MKSTWLLLAFVACTERGDTVPGTAGDASGATAVAASGAVAHEAPDAATGIRLQQVATGLESPVYLTAPRGDARSFIVEQGGRIRILKNGAVLPAPFLDIASRVGAGGERGLLSVAFHPQYATNGFFYVDYTDRNGDTHIERYHVGTSPDAADAGSAKVLLTIKQPYANHNGGLVMFGPDGMLYIGMGDGGSGGDPHGNGQNRAVLLGKILRIDVDHGDPYAIPATNPFARGGGAREVWAYGMRNPWRFAFDAVSSQLIIADVGQNKWEEIDVAPVSAAGLNYGWNTMEGMHCYVLPMCSKAGLTQPILEYSHSSGCSITGGFVYRGHAMPALAGTYFYSDYCQGWLKSIRIVNGKATESKTWAVPSLAGATSFGEDGAGEMYVMTSAGSVYKLVNAQ